MNKTLSCLRTASLLVAGGLGTTQSQAVADNAPSRWPSATEHIAIRAPKYKRPPDSNGECLGRIAFKLPAQVEWPTAPHDSYGNPFNHIFSAQTSDAGDAIEIGPVRVAVIHPAYAETKIAL